jgi:hypothetical protein
MSGNAKVAHSFRAIRQQFGYVIGFSAPHASAHVLGRLQASMMTRPTLRLTNQLSNWLRSFKPIRYGRPCISSGDGASIDLRKGIFGVYFGNWRE